MFSPQYTAEQANPIYLHVFKVRKNKPHMRWMGNTHVS
jgi:hypothetical protein